MHCNPTGDLYNSWALTFNKIRQALIEITSSKGKNNPAFYFIMDWRWIFEKLLLESKFRRWAFRSYVQIIEMALENKYFGVINQQEIDEKHKNMHNNWLQPPPMQFHLINSPSLNFELSQIAPQTSKYSPDFFKNKSRDLTKVPKRNKERQRFKKLREELKILESSLQSYKELRESELLAYKQTLLMEYLGNFIKDIAIECNEKADFMKQIWNTLIRIFNHLFQRLISEGKQKQHQFLREQIKTHNDYQTKLEEYMKINQQLKHSDQKYQGIIKQLVTNIAKSNTELKGLRSLFDSASINLKEITQKYEELRAEHVEILVNGFYDPVSREKAESLMMDKEMLLFAKKMTNSKKGVRQKKGERKAKIITNQIDVNLLLEELQAEQQYSFELDQSQKKEVTYSNQKVQTSNMRQLGESVSIQCDYFSRRQQGMLKQRSNQTNIQFKLLKFDTSTQVLQNQLFKRQFKRYHTMFYTFYPSRFQENHSIKLIKSPTKQHQPSTYKKIIQTEDACTSISAKQFQENEYIQTTESNIIIQPKKRQSKMMKVSNRQSQRGSRIYFQKALKTQNSGEQKRFSQSSSKKMSNYSRKSQFIIFQNLKQNMMKNISNFKKNYSKLHSLQQSILSKILNFSYQSNSIDSLIDTALLQLSYQSIQKDKTYYQNLQLSKLNAPIQDKLNLSINPYKKTGSFVNAHKCLKGINQIYKIAKRYINIGCRSINLLAICCEYLTAVEGKIVDLQSNNKRLIDFLRSCLSLYGENYLIRNFILLSGLQPPSKDERVLKMSKISFDSIKNKAEMMKMNKTIDFPTINYATHESDEDSLQHLYPLMIYYSEVDIYFELLDSLNCSQNKQDLSKYYTTFERVQKIIYLIQNHYKNSSHLITDITQAVKLSIQDWGSENQSKLNIFKCLQLVIDKILAYKIGLYKDFSQILNQSDEQQQKMMKTYIHQLISLSGVTQSEYIQLIIISDQAYHEVNINNLSTLFVIQGLKLDLSTFMSIEKQCRVGIMKKVTACKEQDRRYSSIIDTYSKANMKKKDIYLMLRGLWIRQSNKVLEDIIGEDLQTLFGISVPFGESERGVGFHQMIREALHFW